jgi:hypothetical protein
MNDKQAVTAETKGNASDFAFCFDQFGVGDVYVAPIVIKELKAVNLFGLEWHFQVAIAGVGAGLALHWPSTGPPLALHWPFTGPSLALHWPSTGPSLARHWPVTGPSLARHWPVTGMFAETLHGRRRWFLYPPTKSPKLNPRAASAQWLRDVYPTLTLTLDDDNEHDGL